MDTLRAVRVSTLAKELARVTAGGDFEAMPSAGWGGGRGLRAGPYHVSSGCRDERAGDAEPQAVDMLRAAQVSALARSWQR